MDKLQQKLNILGQILEENQDDSKRNSEGWLTLESVYSRVEGQFLLEVVFDLQSKSTIDIIMFDGAPHEHNGKIAFDEDGFIIREENDIWVNYVVIDEVKLKEEFDDLNEWFVNKGSGDIYRPTVRNEVGGFTVYTNDVIKYNNTFLNLAPRDCKVLRELLNNCNSYIDFLNLRMNADLNPLLDSDSVRKYVNRVKRVLEENTTKTIDNKRDIGWKIIDKE